MSDQSGATENTEEITELIRVRFWGNPRPHTFRTEGHKYRHRQMVVAESDRGSTVGIINSFPFQKKVPVDKYPPIEREATKEDLEKHEKNQQQAKEIKAKAMDLVEELNLNMAISHVTPMDFTSKVVIYFTAPERVDFRELLRRLTREVKGQIELCHISAQERAEALGVIGSCGHTSSSFLRTAKKRGKGQVSVQKAFTRF